MPDRFPSPYALPPMQRFCAAGLLLIGGALASPASHAEDNILGLPAVLQRPAPAASAPKPALTAKDKQAAAAAAAAAKNTVPASAIRDGQIKSALNGGLTLASSYLDTLTTVRVTTAKAYAVGQDRNNALAAARLMQRDVVLSCGQHCKPAQMAKPELLADGKLSFEMVIDGYPGTLKDADMVTLLLGKPLPVPARPPAKPATPAPPAQAAPDAPAQPAPAPLSAPAEAPAPPAPGDAQK